MTGAEWLRFGIAQVGLTTHLLNVGSGSEGPTVCLAALRGYRITFPLAVIGDAGFIEPGARSRRPDTYPLRGRYTRRSRAAVTPHAAPYCGGWRRPAMCPLGWLSGSNTPARSCRSSDPFQAARNARSAALD